MKKLIPIAATAFVSIGGTLGTVASFIPSVQGVLDGSAVLAEVVVGHVNDGLDLYCAVPEEQRLALRERFGGRIVVNCEEKS